MFSGASHPDVSDAGGDHLHTGGQYALDSQAEQDQYEGELQCLADRVETPEEKKRLSEAMELSNIREHLKSQDVYIVEVPLRSKNGKYRQKQIRCMYLNQQTGTLLLMLSDVEDIVKEEKEKQEQLEKALKMAEAANEAKTKFLAGMSHEIRTPMNAIIGYADLASRHLEDTEKLSRYIDNIQICGEKLLSLLSNVLDLARIENNKVEMQYAVSDVREDFTNCVTMFQQQAESKNQTLCMTEQILYPYVYVDEPHLSEVCINIISNAVKYTNAGGTISCKVAQRPCENEDWCDMIISITDNGIGMAEEFQKHIFEPFAQEHAGSRTKFAGTGLGMPITKKLVEKMGGTISFESKEGTGTTFVIRIPFQIDADMKDRNETEEKTETSIQGLHVLLTEDNELNMEIAEFVLQNEGAVVTKAWNGQKAVDIFRKSRPGEFDAILMDIMMPVMNGYEAAKMIRSLDREDAKEIPIIAMTANAFTEDRIRAKEAGMDEHVAKPVDVELLVKVIHKLVG